ncbi:VanZ like protein [Herbihabitans rhizosphaerae]|uniref:VanZ like protein n=1 Tax=Herbihabitans rhizosphaerae TaxID=1872711 RepID=A0A4Q7KBJ7_9PSEU|nr:VanZ like protein [Herbihabitans rhizosphaerae]
MLRDALTDALVDQPGVLPTLIGSGVGFGAVAWFAADRFGWARGPSLIAAVGLALALSVTLARFGVNPVHPRQMIDGCRANTFSLSGAQQLLNFAMLVPFGFFGTLATRRGIPVLLISTGVSALIEVLQGATGVGVCEAQDLFNNTAGAAVAVLNAVALRRTISFHRNRMRYGRHAAAPGRTVFAGFPRKRFGRRSDVVCLQILTPDENPVPVSRDAPDGRAAGRHAAPPVPVQSHRTAPDTTGSPGVAAAPARHVRPDRPAGCPP